MLQFLHYFLLVRHYFLLFILDNEILIDNFHGIEFAVLFKSTQIYLRKTPRSYTV